MPLLSLDISGRGRGGTKKGRKAKDFPGQRLFPGSCSSCPKGCSRFTAKEDEVSLLLLAGDLILCCSHPPCLRLPPPQEQHHQHFILARDISGLLERSGCWMGLRVGSTLVSVIYGVRGSGRGHCKTWQQGKSKPSALQRAPSRGAGSAFTPRHKAPHYSPTRARQCGHSSPGNASWMWAGAAARCSRARGGGQGPISRY